MLYQHHHMYMFCTDIIIIICVLCKSSDPAKYFWLYLIVIPWARVVCLIYTPEARGPQARGLRVYISGKPRVHMV